MGGLWDSLNLTGLLFVPCFHWLWMLVTLALGAWIGWRTAGEGAPPEDCP